MGEEIKAKFTVVEREPIKATFKIAPPSLNYNLLFNKPQINSVELTGNKSLSDLGIIQAITDNITTHNASEQAHPFIRGLITAETEARASADFTLQGNINTEIQNRINADNALGVRITQEATARANADTILQNNITAEANARIAADNSERSSRENADITLQNNITAEATTRANADTTLQNNITTEATTRAEADTSLGSRITEEINARMAGDIALQADITAEATTRSNADQAIIDSIGNGKLTIQKNGTMIAEFMANQKGNTTANIIADTPAWGNITGTLSNQTDLQNALDNKVTKNADITGATKCKITYDSKGLVTAGDNLIEGDIPSLHLTKISDITSTAAEVNYLSGATSNIQGQINNKEPLVTLITNAEIDAMFV